MADRAPSGPGDLQGVAELDLGRATRRGYPEAVLCERKTPGQVASIALALKDAHDKGTTTGPALFTRAPAAHAEAVLRGAARCDPRRGRPDPRLASTGTGADRRARRGALRGDVRPTGGSGGPGHADLSRRPTEFVVDIGVAGIHRVLAREDLIRSARAIVVVAGMDGALASVVAGLASAPVVAVPTSVGYGAAFEGLAPLLSMLNACSPGVGVVNIDNGYGAGHLAAQIAADPS